MLKRYITFFLFHTGILNIVGSLRRAIQKPRVIVLCYHRIQNQQNQPAVSANVDNFIAQLNWFSKRFAILSLDHLAKLIQENKPPSRDSIVLTFDDGYSDNFETVLPLLKKHQFPAAFFISTDPLIERKPYWYDVLWHRLENWDSNKIAAFPRDWTNLLPQETLGLLKKYRVEPQEKWLQKIVNQAKGFNPVLRDAFLEKLKQQQKSGITGLKCETMSVSEAIKASESHIEIGGHSVNHPSLARIENELCKNEILQSWIELLAKGFKPKYFAYPFGESQDVGAKGGVPYTILKNIHNTKNALGEFLPKVKLAFTTEERAIRKNEDPLLIPRKVISPQSLPQIALKLEMLAWQK